MHLVLRPPDQQVPPPRGRRPRQGASLSARRCRRRPRTRSRPPRSPSRTRTCPSSTSGPERRPGLSSARHCGRGRLRGAHLERQRLESGASLLGFFDGLVKLLELGDLVLERSEVRQGQCVVPRGCQLGEQQVKLSDLLQRLACKHSGAESAPLLSDTRNTTAYRMIRQQGRPGPRAHRPAARTSRRASEAG